MANNKVQLANGTVLIDLTDTTATASDVVSGSYFYNAAGVKQSGTLVVDQTYSVTKTLTNVTSNNDDTKVLAGGSYYADLTPMGGYYITSVSVTMGGVDITDQVFQPGLGYKSIDENGTYVASAENLGGYATVRVNVPTGSTPTGTKSISISANGTTTEDVANYASAEITVNVPNSYAASDEGKVVSNGALVAQTSDTVTANGTVDTTLISSLTVSVPTGGGGTTCVTGTFSPASNLRTVTLSDTIGKNNLAIFCQTNFNPAPVNRTHGYDLFINGKLLIVGSTNSNGTGVAATMTLSPEGNGRSDVTWNRTTGVVTISAGATSSYGGYYASGLTYGYCAW